MLFVRKIRKQKHNLSFLQRNQRLTVIRCFWELNQGNIYIKKHKWDTFPRKEIFVQEKLEMWSSTCRVSASLRYGRSHGHGMDWFLFFLGFQNENQRKKRKKKKKKKKKNGLDWIGLDRIGSNEVPKKYPNPIPSIHPTPWAFLHC